MTAGPCLCGDPVCGRCFPTNGRRFLSADLADVVAAWAVESSRNGPSPDLTFLAAVDVAWLLELTIQAVRVNTHGRAGRDLDGAIDSALAGRLVDLIRQADEDADVAGAEK